MKRKVSLRSARAKAIALLLALSMLSPASAQEVGQKTVEPLGKGASVAGRDVPAPNRKKFVAPEYPADAAARGIRGIVILDVLIGEDGKVLDARVTRSIPGLDEAAVAALKLWEYEPSKVAGKPVKVLLSQSITFAMKLPELQRALGVPELKSGGAPPAPSSLNTPETASVAVTLGAEGEVAEAAVLEGNAAISEALLRAVKSWRFEVSEGTTPSFTVQAEWKPGTRPTLTLRAFDLKKDAGVAAASSTPASAGATITDTHGKPTDVMGAAGTPTPMAPSPSPSTSPSRRHRRASRTTGPGCQGTGGVDHRRCDAR